MKKIVERKCVETVSEISVTKLKGCHYRLSKKDRKNAIVGKKCNKNVRNIVLSFATIVRKMLSRLLTCACNFSVCLSPE